MPFAPLLALASTLALSETPDLHDLVDRWAAVAPELGVPGFAVVVVQDGETILNATWGQRDVDRDLPVTEDTLFYIASATKPFVAFALAKLADEGLADLDRPVKSYLPRFELADEVASDTIETRDLLCHRPGLDSLPIVFLDAYTGEITEDRYYHFLRDVEPLGRISYSNVHFTLAGRVIQAVTGLEWREYLRREIFEPLGLERTTGYADWMYAQEDVALPTVFEDGVVRTAPVRKSDATMHAAGGLGISSADAGRWLALNLGRGTLDGRTLLSAQAAEDFLSPQATYPEPNGWLRRIEGFALGWQIGTYRGHRYLQHGGGYVGASAHFSFLPDDGIGVAVLVNAGPGGQALCAIASIDVQDRLLGDESGYDPLPGFLGQIRAHRARQADADGDGAVEAAATRALAAFELPLEAYAGTYTNEHWGTLSLAAAQGGELSGRIGQLGVRVEPLGGQAARLFTAGDGDASTAEFVVADARVVAALVELDDGLEPVRFERRD